MATPSGPKKGFSLKGDVTELERLQKDFVALADKMDDLGAVTAIAKRAKGMIIERTQKGIDIRGRAFKEYSEVWGEWREKKGLPTGTVNLTVTGTLMNSIDFIVKGPLEAELKVLPYGHMSDPGVTTRDDIAEWHQQGDGVPKREWFGLTPDQLSELERQWVGLTLQLLLDTITDARPMGEEVSQLRGLRKISTKPKGPFASYTQP